MTHRLAVVAATACALAFPACRAQPSLRETSPRAAVVNGTAISVAAVDAWIKDELFNQKTAGGNPTRTYQLRKGALARLIEHRVVEAEAKRSGLDVDAMLRRDVEANNPVTQAELVEFFEENRERMGNTTFADASPHIREYLEELRAREARQAMVARAAVTVELVPPRVEIEADGPSLGPEDAPVTIVEFGDFQCPFCRKAAGRMYSLAEKYPEEVRIVYRHLPLESIHPRARAAAEAAACAADQGLFWAYHDRLFANPRAFGDRGLRGHARELGADTAVFDACFEKREHAAVVDADVAAAAALGITGTPAFAINGILLSGLQSEETLEKLIRAELENAGAARAATP